ncbi:HIT domain-containing protein [Candidatus Micrarchaeota archaeon]|nr:HIT domain-containing protein [Candidatus Micrarchaeota archaeon]
MPQYLITQRPMNMGTHLKPPAGKKKDCPFCPIDEVPIERLHHSCILSQPSPYVPKHALFVSNEHSGTLAELGAGAMNDLCFFAKALFSYDPKMALIINHGLAAGQSISHFHAHALPLSTPQSSMVRTAHPHLAFNDPLSVMLLHNAAGQFAYEFPRVWRSQISLDEPVSLQMLVSKMAEALKSTFQAAKTDFSQMLIPPIYEKFNGAKERLQAIFKDHAARELGFNWCIRMHNGTPVIEMLPRVLKLKIGGLKTPWSPEGRSGIGAYEVFCNTTAMPGSISEQEAVAWQQEQGTFFTQLRAALQS